MSGVIDHDGHDISNLMEEIAFIRNRLAPGKAEEIVRPAKGADGAVAGASPFTEFIGALRLGELDLRAGGLVQAQRRLVCP